MLDLLVGQSEFRRRHAALDGLVQPVGEALFGGTSLDHRYGFLGDLYAVYSHLKNPPQGMSGVELTSFIIH